ncbi:hypothetical protein BC834DRAFT_840735 [Gloeopeniophorella convolvens]|nr:hypothetical protein BC834DRAFT_840735 [Gloeopeniophorella convolvens]
MSPARTPSPSAQQSDTMISSNTFSYFSLPVKPTSNLASSSTATPTATTSTASSAPITPDHPLNPIAAQARLRLTAMPSPILPPPSPLSLSESGDAKDVRSERSEEVSRLQASLSHLWTGNSYSTDGETEAEESEAESSVVHTEAESDAESVGAFAALKGDAKGVRAGSVTVASATDDDDEGEMTLVELESGVITFVRVPRRR